MHRILAAAFSLLLCALPLSAQDNPAQPTRIKGCTVVVGFRDLRVFYERAVVVAEKETAPDAPPEWWGFYPDRKPVLDDEGHERAVNIPKAEFLKVGEVRVVRMEGVPLSAHAVGRAIGR